MAWLRYFDTQVLMPVRRPWLLGACAAALLAGCADPSPQPASAGYARPVDTRTSIDTLSTSLAPGMTEAQVNALREPDRIMMETCGTDTARPWPCKIYTYGMVGPWIAFAQTAPAEWRVSGWW